MKDEIDLDKWIKGMVAETYETLEEQAWEESVVYELSLELMRVMLLDNEPEAAEAVVLAMSRDLFRSLGIKKNLVPMKLDTKIERLN